MTYRYSLSLNTSEEGSRVLAVIQLNPSTANGEKKDPTVGKVLKWANDNRFATVIFLNLFALVSTDPADVDKVSYDEAVGPENDASLTEAIRRAQTIVVAWGGCAEEIPSHAPRRIREVCKLLDGREISTVGKLVRGGFPRHGLSWNGANRQLRTVSLDALKWCN